MFSRGAAVMLVAIRNPVARTFTEAIVTRSQPGGGVRLVLGIEIDLVVI